MGLGSILGGVAGSFFGPIGTSVGGALGGILDSRKEGRAIERAGDVQQAAAREGISAQERALEQLREDLAPFTEFGLGAIPQLQNALGLTSSEDQGGLGLGPELLENPLLRTLQDDVTRRLFANQAAQGRLGSGGTAAALQNALIPQALDFRQREIDNLFQTLGIGQASAAQTGAGALSTGARIGEFSPQVARAGTTQRLGREVGRQGTLDALGGLFGNQGVQDFIGNIFSPTASFNPSGLNTNNLFPSAGSFGGF